jgi:hypothetical protein
MITRITKEIRGQLAALGLVLVVACLVALRRWFLGLYGDFMPTLISEHNFLNFILEVSPYFLLLTICVASSALYTSEYHWRTLQLLLAQPISRARIWTEKLLAVGTGVILFFILFALLNRIAGEFAPSDPQVLMWLHSVESPRSDSFSLWVLAILVVVLCAPFWSIISRTLIGAVALNMGSLALVIMLLNAGFHYLQPGASLFSVENRPSGVLPMLWVGGLVYAGAFVWLGWRKFKRMELADGSGDVVVDGLNTATSSVFGTLWKASLLQISLRLGPVLTKELRLQRPTLLLSGLLVVFWCAAVAVCWILPGTKENVELFLGLAAGFYVPIVVLLSASISIAEESRIGIYEWHLSFPIARWRLWALKLGVGLGSAIVRGVLVPLVLGVVTFPEFRQAVFEMLTGNGEAKAAPFIIILGTLFVVGFWSAVYLRDTIRSILGAVLVIVVGCGLLAFTGWTSESSQLQTGLVSWYIAWQQLTTYTAMNHIGRLAFVVACLGLPALLLWLSLRAMRRNTQGLRAFERVAALVLVAVGLLAFWIGDLVRSVPTAQAVFEGNLRNAIQWLPAEPHDKEGVRELRVEELERTGALLPVTRYWLRGSSIRLVPGGGKQRDGSFWLEIKLEKPGFESQGGAYGQSFPVPYYGVTNKLNSLGNLQSMRRYGVDATRR